MPFLALRFVVAVIVIVKPAVTLAVVIAMPFRNAVPLETTHGQQAL
jgi:hypothetical protein